MAIKETKKTKITLLSWTQNPMETIYAEWQQSRTQGPVDLPANIAETIRFERQLDQNIVKLEYPLEPRVLEVFKQVVDMKMPLGETIDFVFLIEHMPVALREQMVRHRIGHKFGDRLGADIIPDLAGNSTFWSQTTRIVDMGTFATDGEYFEPIWFEDHGDKPMPGYKPDMNNCPKCHSEGRQALSWGMERSVGGGSKGKCSNGHTYTAADLIPTGTIREFYQEQMGWIQSAYNRLVKAGMPLEDARNILPVAMQHRMTWKVNFSSLMHVLSRRGCWLAQLGMWRPVIEGIIEELSTKVHPSFRRLIDPPCFDGAGNYTKCAFGKENEEIISQGDYPPCSLWINNDLAYQTFDQGNGPSEAELEARTVKPERMPRYRRMQERYAQLWRRDPVTGERKQLT